MSLTKKAMLATLNISLLGMSGVDRKATRDANNHFGTSQLAGRYQKCRIHRNDIRMIINAADFARRKHRELTRPWDDQHWRMLPAAMLIDYSAAIRECRRKFEDAVMDKQNQWPVVVESQEQRLGPLFNAKDYPGIYFDPNIVGAGRFVASPDLDLLKYFTFEHRLRPLPDKSHYVQDLEEEILEELKQDLDRENQNNLKNSSMELFQRLYEPVANMAEILGNDKKIYKTLITNIEQVVNILPKLNVENNIDLTRLINEVQQKLTGHTVGQIRQDKNLKKDFAVAAESLKSKMDTMKIYMQGRNSN